MAEVVVPSLTALESELVFSTSRSSGPGGQNVNKVNSKVTLKFDVYKSQVLSTEQRDLLLRKLTAKLTNEGILVLTSQDKRSQLQNKEAVILKFNQILINAFKRKKKRTATKPTKSSVRNRVSSKKKLGEKKRWRQKPGD